MVRKAWEVPTSCGNSLEGIRVKLKKLKIEIKRWNREVVSNMKIRKQRLIEEM